MKVLFFGTPQIAVPFLDWLIAHTVVVGAVCKKDEPVGRGYKITPPPVKILAHEKGVPVFQPQGPWTDEKVQMLQNTEADVGIAVAYGRLMPKPVFETPNKGTINVHFSLLPKYRGAAPMQWSLINGEKESGVTLFWIEEGMDSGPIHRQSAVPISNEDNAISLKEKLVKEGLTLLEKFVDDFSHGKLMKNPQKGKATLAPVLKKEMGLIDWTQSASSISNLVRGLLEWPVATTIYKPSHTASKRLKILKARPMEYPGKIGKPGEVLVIQKDQGLVVQTGNGQLILQEVQSEGKKAMPAISFWQGARLKVGDRFY